ncbi:hypothetical protein ACNI3K_00855 [Demequina sp. SO4-13]|uniref:hypothetical protein n=1 Tax=Demequina sp. SO4-13 TaxID=3401027 RepID=UPI003AF4364C
MIESRIYKREAELGLTGGALRRRQALRVVRDGTITPAATPDSIQLRLRADGTFAQHGVLGSPDALVVRVVVENTGAQPVAVRDVDVAFDLSGAHVAIDTGAGAGWRGPAEGWSFTLTRIGVRVAVALLHRGPIEPGATAEATFQLNMTPEARLAEGLTLRASGHADGQPSGSWSSEITFPVERLTL